VSVPQHQHLCKGTLMDDLKLLLADRILARAQQFKLQEKNTHAAQLKISGFPTPTQEQIDHWALENPDTKFMKMAYDELHRAAVFIDTLKA
jgi:hypothetical protein